MKDFTILLPMIDNLDNAEDQKIGRELLNTLKQKEMKPGYLKKFEEFF